MEQELRRAECYEALRQVRTGSAQYTQMIPGQNINAQGEKANTRAQTLITRVSTRVDNAQDDYNRSYQALINLGLDQMALKPLQKLRKSNFEDLHAMLSGARDVPQGNLTLPWVWHTRESISRQPDITDQEEYAEGVYTPAGH
ncbi:hypothetical protein RSOL_013380 [Rhizoctonia solani AG-3 Rhs1AP]|uniref:Uncharacterized protein n=2 Tax=Rhizoctonia solani AG-3 TaxID=1086053 RepID=X8IWM3_9AGAM|nr:hypothetical protein RSOL_013380 [Rhizoctonia solani AG-3 Rhs1AP]